MAETSDKMLIPDSAFEKENKKNNCPQPEHGGPKGLEPTRYGDWERSGICKDF